VDGGHRLPIKDCNDPLIAIHSRSYLIYPCEHVEKVHFYKIFLFVIDRYLQAHVLPLVNCNDRLKLSAALYQKLHFYFYRRTYLHKHPHGCSFIATKGDFVFP